MFWMGKIVFGITALVLVLLGIWLFDTNDDVVQMAGLLTIVVGGALGALAYGDRADWNRLLKARDKAKKDHEEATERND